ncbi:flavin reductase [Bosea sp. (in: a-proteobacteria)]
MTRTVQPFPPEAEPPPGQAFRDAMAQVASAVHVVTTIGPAGRLGMTATAVASVSDKPPTVLVCIERSSRTLAAIEASGVFCVNTLPGHLVETAEIFANRRALQGEERFAAGEWGELVTGSPVLRGALAAFDCRLVASHDIATHRVLVGEVVGLGGAGQGGSLIYRRRQFEAV